MLNKNQIEIVGAILGANKGKFGTVVFRKKNGDERTMRFRQGVKKYLKGGNWSNSDSKPTDHNLVLVYDIENEAYKSFKIDSVESLKIGGETFEV